MTVPQPERFEVPVDGGSLLVGRWGSGPNTLLALHGITANHMSWPAVAAELGDDVTLVAPDLRGRGGSAGLPGPFGMRRHADDAVAILDHLGLDAAVVVGHSMGGFVACTMATAHPERVSQLVLVDGGASVAEVPPDADVDAILQAVIGPALDRLKMTFESREAYLDFWRAHPAMKAWSEVVEAYIDYDLVGEAPQLRSSASLDAVRGDAADTLTDPSVVEAIERLTQPTVFLRAERGMLDGDPLYPAEVIEALAARVGAITAHTVADVNHYTIVIGSGAATVADHCRAAVGLTARSQA